MTMAPEPEAPVGPLQVAREGVPIAVLGAGSWGTGLAIQFARSGHPVTLWGRSSKAVEQMLAGEPSPYLPEAPLPEQLQVTTDLGDCRHQELVVVAVPSKVFREVLRTYLQDAPTFRQVVVSGTKGIETDTLARMSQVCFEESARADRDVGFAVLSGPTFADELVAGLPSAAVIASAEREVAGRIQGALSGGNFRLYTSTDVVGVELGGTAKNVIAIAAGVIAGLGMGHNTLAALMTRGLHEITRLGLACGGRPRTFSGLAGMGDLVLTCTGGQSRNRRTGEMLAQGLGLDEISERIGMVAEGVRNAEALTTLAVKRRIEMPITEMMSRVVHHGKDPREAVEELMGRDLKGESEL